MQNKFLTINKTSLPSKRRKKAKVKKLPAGIEPIAKILRGLEISLRTNKLSWVKEFISYSTPIIDDPKAKKKKSKGVVLYYNPSLSRPRIALILFLRRRRDTSAVWKFSWITLRIWT